MPTQMTVQGKLTNPAGDPVPAGPKTFTFKIYDVAIGGAEVWPAGPGEVQPVSTDADGLWTAQVGAVIALTDAVFTGDQRWLEVTVNDGVNPPETLSRVKLNTNPYTFQSEQSRNAVNAATADDAARLGGQLPSAYAPASHPHAPADITPQGSGSTLDADLLDGQDAAAFAAVGHGHSEADISNEPGIARNHNQGAVLLPQGAGTMTDLVTVTITTPADGYIFVQGRAFLQLTNTTGANHCIVQVTEVAGGGMEWPYFADGGLNGYSNPGGGFFSVYADRVYYRPAGTYTFRFVGKAQSATGGAVAQAFNNHITAIYLPTAYGTVVE